MVEGSADSRDAKRRLRLGLLTARAGRSAAEREQAAQALCDRVLALPEVRDADLVTCYVSMPEEPGTGPLLKRLSDRGSRVLLPVLRPDFDLSWAAYQPGALRSARFGTTEPTGPPLGPDAVTAAGVIVCPGLAVDDAGHRIGRGGGSFDRVLRRVPPGALRVVLVYDDEVLAAIPTDEHDQPVNVAVTPSRTLRLGGR